MKKKIAIDANHLNLSLHDAFCLGWNFDYEQKTLAMRLENLGDSDVSGLVIFENVLGHEMKSCDFWGPTLRIGYWSILDAEQCRLYPKYIAELQQNDYNNIRLNPNQSYLEIEILFISGDTLTILCQNVSVETEDTACS